MDDDEAIFFVQKQRLAVTTTVKRTPRLENRWWRRVLESRWFLSLGKSQLRCAIISILLHLTIAAILLIRLDHQTESSSAGYPSIVPVELVTLGEETNMTGMVSRQLPYAPSDHQAEAAAAKPEPAPGLEMKLFPDRPIPSPENGSSNDDGTSAADDKPSSLKDAKLDRYDVNKVGEGTGLTMSISDYLRNQIAACWHPPHIRRPRDVAFELFLDRSGAIERPPRLLLPADQTSESIAASEGVRQAIYTCAPYKLPLDRFEQWRQLIVRFDANMWRELKSR